MTTAATTGKGTQLKREGTAIKEVRNLAINGVTADTIDVSNMDSGEYREFITGFKNGGEVAFTCNFLPADSTHIALLQDFKDSVLSDYIIVLTDSGNTEMDFTALVQSYNVKADTNDALLIDFTLKVSGAMGIEGVS